MPNLNYILSKKFDESYTISFIGGPQEITEQGAVFKTPVLNNISSIKSFSDQTEGETSGVYFTKFFKYKNGPNWSDMLPINQMSGMTFNCVDDFQLELYYFRTIDGNYSDTLHVNNIVVSGNYILSVYDSEAELPNNGDMVILAPKDIYKIFSISNFQVNAAPHNSYDIQYRFTQDDNRTYTPWEPLTQENISTIKLNPLRFAKVEYSIKNTSEQGLLVYDVILEGDFQNVSANYLKTNRYGLKQDCLTAIQNKPGAPGSDTTNRDFYTSCLGSYNQYTDIATQIGIENNKNTAQMWNPYDFNKITSFGNLLAGQVSNILGWTVDYHLTDPDGNGIDKYLHEYTLKNIVDVKSLRIVVPDNKFPVEAVLLNQFNLDLFESFEIHITKDEFKNAFGITKRPAEDDIIYICQANMLYSVKHAQAHKNIMNSAIYYKLILEKYEHKTNIRNLVEESQQQIDALTDNSTIESLFGDDMIMEENKIANKDQTYPTTIDNVRTDISSKVTLYREDVFLDNFKPVLHYYDLSNKTIKDKVAIDYKKIDQQLKKGDNRCFIFWFKFNDSFSTDKKPSKAMFTDYYIKTGVEFNLLNNYSTTNVGYKMYYQGGNLFFKLNDNLYKLSQELLTNVWYQGVINLNQRQKTLDMYIYRRNSEIITTFFHETNFTTEYAEYGSSDYDYLINNGYKPATNVESITPKEFIIVNSTSLPIEPDKFKNEESLRLMGSNIKYSNLRILDAVIPENSITNILKEHILRDEQHLIAYDNANKTLVTKIYFNKNFR